MPKKGDRRKRGQATFFAYRYIANDGDEPKKVACPLFLLFLFLSDCGIAEVTLDGKTVKEIDTYCPRVDWNRTTVLVSGLKGADAAGTVKIKVTGRKNPKSRNSYVQIVRFEPK